MDIVVILLPALLGIIAAYFIAEYVTTLYYHRNFLSEDKYLQLYDELDSEYHFKTINKISETQHESYAEYLRLLESGREGAYRRFRTITNSMLIRVASVAIIPSVVFILLSPFSAIAYTAALTVSIYFYSNYLAVNKKQTRDFYITLVASIVLKG